MPLVSAACDLTWSAQFQAYHRTPPGKPVNAIKDTVLGEYMFLSDQYADTYVVETPDRTTRFFVPRDCVNFDFIRRQL